MGLWLGYSPGTKEALDLTLAPHKQAVVSHTCHPSIRKVEAGDLGGQDHPGLHGKLEASLSYMKPCLRNQKDLEKWPPRLECSPSRLGALVAMGMTAPAGTNFQPQQ